MSPSLFRKKAADAPLPEDPEALVALSESLVNDPWRRRALVEKAVSAFPDSLRAQYALLMLGQLGTGSRRKADFSQIKSYILTPFEKPEAFGADEKKRLIREIFDHPLLKRCVEMAEDADRFLVCYLKDLAGEYAELFITGSSAHSGAYLGFSTPSSRLKGMSAPLSRMLTNVSSCPYLDARERALLLDAVASAARRITGGDMKLVYGALDPALAKELREKE